MRLYLIRHAQAGDRTFGHRDLYRQLTSQGVERAKAISELLADVGIDRVLSSPATRCVQTVQPLASGLGLEVEEHPDLWEGTLTAHVLALLTAGDAPSVAVCSHGDVIPAVVDAVAGLGAEVRGRGCEKGSIWVLDHVEGSWRRATYVDRSQAELPELDRRI
jgi:8-oxo-dGTP diphosphatase